MEEFAPGGSAVFEFGPKGYRGASGQDILAARELTPPGQFHTLESRSAPTWLTDFHLVRPGYAACTTTLYAKTCLCCCRDRQESES